LYPKSGLVLLLLQVWNVFQAGDDDSEWAPISGHPWKTHRLRLRKGRSVVHKNLEDNYGAVIVANHEALAQVLEQVTGSLTFIIWE
jgi:hypothetical protein